MALTLRVLGDTSASIVIRSSLTRPKVHQQEGGQQEGGYDWCWKPRQLSRASEVTGLGGEPTTPIY